MDQSQLKWIADFIWNIADDRLRDVYVRGKYRDVIFKAVSWRDETAPPVVAKRGKLKADEYFEPGYDGAYLEESGKDRFLVEYEPDSDLRNTEQVQLKVPGGIEAFFEREVLPHAPDAWA